MEIRKLWEIIRRRKWIIFQALLIIPLSAIVGSYLVTPEYSASAKILITSSDTTSSLLSSIGMSNYSSLLADSGSEIDTYLEMATLNPILEETIYKIQIRGIDGDLLKPDNFRTSGHFLPKRFPTPYIEVNKVKGTNIIEITATSTDTLEAFMIANTLANLIIQDNLKYRKEEYRNARIFIENQITKAKADYLSVLKEIEKFMIEEKTIDIEEETKLSISKMGELMKEKEDNIIDLAEVRAKIKMLKKQQEIESVTNVSSSAIGDNPHIELLKKTLSIYEFQLAGLLENEGMVVNSFANETPQIKSLKNSLSVFKADLAGIKNEKSPYHPDVINLNLKIKTTEKELNKEIESIKIALNKKIAKAKTELNNELRIYKKSSGGLQTLERELAALEAHLVGVDADIKKYTAILYTIPKKTAIQAQMKMRLSASQELYSALLGYLSEVGVAEAMTLSDIRLIEPAVIPLVDKPSSPKKGLIFVLSIFLGLMFALGLTFLIEYIDDTIKTPDDLQARDITLMGTIPKVQKYENKIIHKRGPYDPLSESYRTLRNNLKFRSLDKPITCLLLTSFLASEGKTTISINLSISFANDRKKVLLMDTDLRQPGVHKVLGAKNSKGITTILAGETTLNDTVIKSDVEGLYMLTSGPVPADSGHMIESDRFRNLITDITQQYDMVILDSSPILATNDAIVLAKYVDAFMVVLESGVITLRDFTQLKEHFQLASITPIGFILNKYDIKSGPYYRQSYYPSTV